MKEVGHEMTLHLFFLLRSVVYKYVDIREKAMIHFGYQVAKLHFLFPGMTGIMRFPGVSML